MSLKTCGLLTGVLAMSPIVANAQDQGFFAGIDVNADAAFGSSDTTNGGGVPPIFNGDGIVKDVRFGKTVGIGGHLGYRIDPSVSVLISFQHTSGDVSWMASYPGFGVASSFDGSATSNMILGNIVYDLALSELTSLSIAGGLGVAFNQLSDIVETDKPSGLFISDVAGHTRKNLAAQVGLGLRHKIASNATIGLDVALAYTGGYETGTTRSGNTGITQINPYRIDDVWRVSLGVSFEMRF